MNERLEKDRKIQLRAVVSFVLILGVIAITILGMVLLVLNKRVAVEKDDERAIPAVEVMEARMADYQVLMRTQGVVESARETRVAAEVGGRVLAISESLKRGGTVKRGERLVQMEAGDYRAALAAAEVREAEARLALEQEKAKVEQALLDWEKLGRGVPTNALVLRKPYLDAVEARVAAAVEEVAKARRDVERTEILAPFDAGVRSAKVEVGAVVSPGMEVAELYASTDLEVRLPLSLEDYGFLNRDESGAVVGGIVVTGKIGANEYVWKGRAVRVDPEIERKTLSGNVIVRLEVEEKVVDFPLPPVGLFVHAELQGVNVPGVFEIPRRALLEGNRLLVVGEGRRLEFTEVEVVRLNEKSAAVRGGLETGDQVVVTRLPAPIAGMEVQIEAVVGAKKEAE